MPIGDQRREITRSCVGNREKLLRLTDTTQRMDAKRQQRAVRRVRRIMHGTRYEHVPPQWTAQALDAARLVDGRADDGEIEPLPRAYVAVQHFAHVDGYTEIERLLAARSTRRVELRHVGDEVARRLDRVGAHHLGAAFREIERR